MNESHYEYPLTAATTEETNDESYRAWYDVNGMSNETRQLIETLCFAVATSIICLVGIPTNAINCLVFWRQGLQDRMNVCLFCLALVDLLYLMSEFAVFSVSSYIDALDKTLGEEYYLKSLAVWLGVTYGFRSTSGFIGLVIAVERCVCVIFPLRASSLMKARTMAVIICVSLVTFHLCFLISPLSVSIIAVRTEQGVRWVLTYTQMYFDNKDAIDEFGITFLGVVVPVFTFIVVSISTIVTVIRLRSAMAWREKSSSASDSHGHQTALTSMLVLVSCVHIITMVPFVMHALTRVFIQDFSTSIRYYNLFMATSAIVHVFPRINSAVNFFVYCSRSSRFRTTLHDICSC